MDYYNAETRAHCADGIQYPPHEVDVTSPWYKFDVITYERQRKEDTSKIKGRILAMIDGKICEFMQIPAWALKPLRKGEHAHVGGINWGDEYFTSFDEAAAFADSLKVRHDQPQYHHMTDLWSVHYHY